MKLEGKGVLDDHDDNFAIVFAAMGVSCLDHMMSHDCGSKLPRSHDVT